MRRERSGLRRNKVIRPSLVILAVVSCLWGNAAAAQEVNAAMQSFMQAMKSKNPNGILASFSQQTPWKYQPYEIGTGKALKTAVVTPKQMFSDFQKKRGWHDFFLADPNGYTFRLNFMENKPWKKRGTDTFVAPDSDSGKTYITWRLEGQKWVIAVIGDTSP